jgi:hypothetical protein
MKCDFQASLLARTFASPCFGREPKARVVTNRMCSKKSINNLLSNKNTFALGQLMHLAPNLKQYVVSRISLSSHPTHHQAPPFDVGLVGRNLHMEVISMHVEKNIMDDVLLDGE